MVKHTGPTYEGSLKKQAKHHLGQPIFEDLSHGLIQLKDLATMLG